MRIPWSAPTVSDATKLGLCRKGLLLPKDTAGGRIYRLQFLNVITEDFANLSAWTEVDAGTNVNLSSGVVDINGNGSANQNGIWRTAAISLAEGYLEYKRKGLSAAIVHWNGLTSNAGLTTTTGQLMHVEVNSTAGALGIRSNGTGAGPSCTGRQTAGTWYTHRHYVMKDDAGSWLRSIYTIEGGTEYPVETIIGDIVQAGTAFPASMYIQFQRTTNNAQHDEIKEVRWYAGYATDGPTLTYVADAGSGRVFTGFTPTNLAAVGSWATTNVKFKYSYDDGVASYNADWLTLAQLNAESALTTSKRYLRVMVQVLSDGATQQYAGEINADDALSGADDAAPSSNSSASEVSVSESSASEVSVSQSSASEASVSESSGSESSASAGGGGSASSLSYSSLSESTESSASTSASSNSASLSSSTSSESGETTAVNTWEQFIRGNGSYAQIEIQKPARTRSETGATLQTWATTQTLYADIQDSSPRTRERYSSRSMSVDKSIYLASDPACDQGWRVLYGSEYWRINGVEELEKSRLWRLDVEKVY